MSDINELFMQRRNEKVDPYGLTTKTMDGTEINLSETTPFDSFLLTDSLRLIKYISKVDEFKSQNANRKNSETGLYEVTVGDNNTEYYEIATMLNRMTNVAYAKKLSINATLIKDILQPMKSAQSSLNNKIDSLNSQNYPTNTDKELKDRIDQRISEHLMN